MSRLNVRSNEIKYTLKQDETQLEEKKAAIENCKTTLSDIDNEILRAKNRYEYFQQLLQYTDDLGEFADSKVRSMASSLYLIILINILLVS
jgi:predicted  nucleic acid-binding Zn-ribbon protein